MPSANSSWPPGRLSDWVLGIVAWRRQRPGADFARLLDWSQDGMHSLAIWHACTIHRSQQQQQQQRAALLVPATLILRAREARDVARPRYRQT